MPALSLTKARDQADRAKNMLQNFRDKHKVAIKKAGEGAKVIGSTMIAGGTCYGLSYAMTRMNDTEVVGVPYDLGLAVLATGAGLFVDNDAAKFALTGVGTGALCAFAARKGQEHGESARLVDAQEAVAENKK